MITKLMATALSAALVLGTASATFAASKTKKHAAPREATVATAPQPDRPYASSVLPQAPTTQPVRDVNPEPQYFNYATGREAD